MIDRHIVLSVTTPSRVCRFKPLPILKTAVWPDETATQAFAQTLAKGLLHQGLDGCINLEGDLGAGKTTLVRHLLHALGVSGRIKSPTYAVVEPYAVAAGAIWHFDFYRFNDPQEWEDAGFRDVFATPGLKVCEWPERVTALLPEPDLHLNLSVLDDTQRHVQCTAHSARAQRWLQGWLT
ncbi:MAG: tRNA threonylcarbamoyladenosine biosynthesis protein TsaE [Pseudomonadota bacterium]